MCLIWFACLPIYLCFVLSRKYGIDGILRYFLFFHFPNKRRAGLTCYDGVKMPLRQASERA